MAGKAHLKYAAAILILLASALLFFSLPKELTDGFFLFLEARQAPANYAAAVLEFNFSKNDLRSFAMEGAATDSRKVQLKAKNSLHDVEISNYSDSQKSAIPQRPSFTIQFNDEFFRENRLRTFRLFPQEGFSPDEIAPIYALADELGIHSLGSEAATLKINGVNYHSYFLKPQYDADSLEYIGAPGSMVFKAADSKSRFTYVASAFEMPGASEHLTNFFILADAMDPNILVKYFDFDYLARYEALRELLGAQEGFMLSRDTLFLYNSANGKIYPIFDEANVKNINSKNSGAMAYLSEKISGNKYIGALKQNYLHELAASPVAQQLSSSPSKFIPSNFTATLAQYKNRPPAPTPAFSPVEKYLSSPSAYLDEMATMPEIPATKTPAKIADEAGVSALLADVANSILNGEKPQWLASSSLLGSSCLSSPHSGCWLQIADMEDNSTWACYGNGCGITPSHFKEGKNGYHVPAASTAYSYITAIDLGSHDHISVWVYANQSGGQMHIALGSGASAKFYYTFIPSAGWNHISAPKSDFAKAGSANWSAISYIEAINSQPNSFAIFDDLRAIMQGSQFGAEQELPAFVPESGVWELQKGDLGPLVAGLEPKGEGILQYNKYIGSNALHMLRVNLNYGELAGYQMGDFFVGIHDSGEIGCTSKGKASNSSYIGAAAHDWVDLLLVSNSSFVAAYYKTTLMGSFALLCNAPYYPNGKVRLKHIGERQLFDGLAVYEPYPEEYEQMRLVQSNGNFIVPRGNYYINGTFFLPAGKTLEIEKGTKICLAKNSSLVSYGNVQALGTQESPILIRPCLPSEKFGVFAIVGPNQGTSNIQYLDISGGSEAYIKGAYFSGALSIYYADASISNSKIHHNNADDGLNVKHSKVSINTSEFYSNFADSADLDFCEGSVKDSVFSPKIYKKGKPPEYAPLDINGDGLDISGSHLLVQNNSFFGMLDKGMSIGENSYAALLSNSFRSNRLGVAVKDLSHVLFVGNSVSSNTVAMSAYRKKEIFGGGKIYSVANKFFENQKTYELDRNSQLFTLEKEPGLQDILASADKNAISSLFSLLAADSNSSQNNVLSFKVGATDARIDKNAKIIFASLPLGPQPMQTISYELENNAAQVSIAPISIGANAPFFGNETLLENNATYDFGGYIFTGTVIFKTCSRNGTCQNDFFSLYVTTGDVPLLELNTMNEFGSPLPIFDEQDTPVSLRIISQNKNDSDSGLQGFIGTRGFQLGEKRKYSFELPDKKSLLGMPSSKEWVLEGSTIDRTLMRNKFASDLLSQFRGDKAQPRIAAQNRFVEVYLNGRYHGVYLLMESAGSDMLNFKNSDATSAYPPLMFKPENGDANYLPTSTCLVCYPSIYNDSPYGLEPKYKDENKVAGWHSGYSQVYPSPKKYGETFAPLDEFVKFAATSSDAEFNSRIGSRLDAQSYLDAWLLLNFIDNSDAAEINKLMARRGGSGERWFVLPYDFDLTLGWGYQYLRLTTRDETGWTSNNLFCRLMKNSEYQKHFLLRWQQLRTSGTISEKNLFSMLDSSALLLADAQRRNYERFPITNETYTNPSDFNAEIASAKNWLRSRIAWMDNMLSSDNGSLVQLSCPDPNPSSTFSISQNSKNWCEKVLFSKGKPECSRPDFSFNDSYAYYVFLDTAAQGGNIGGAQKSLLFSDLNSVMAGNQTHLFIFINSPVFLAGNDRYAMFSSPSTIPPNNFYKEIMPVLLALNKNNKQGHIISIGDSTGSLFYDNYAGIDFIATGFSSKGENLGLNASVLQQEARFMPLNEGGNPIGKNIRDFSPVYWLEK